MKCNETQGKWCKNKHGASKIIDTFERYQRAMEARAFLVEGIVFAVGISGLVDGLVAW
jgi:hypothetical protein